MSFPTADILDGHARLLQAWGIASKLKDRRPDLADRVIVDDARPLVRLVLPDSRSISCAPVQLGNAVNWAVWTPESDLDSQMEHRFDIHTTDALADMTLAAYDELTSVRS